MAREITKEELFEWVDPNLRKWANNFFQKDFTLRRLDPNAQMLISLKIFESLSKDHLTQIIQKTTLATNKQEVARNLVKPLIEDVNFKKHLRTEIDKFKQVVFLSQKELITALYDEKRGLTSGYIPEIYTPLEKIPQSLEKTPQQLEEKNREKEEQKKLFLQNIHTAIKEIEDHKKTWEKIKLIFTEKKALTIEKITEDIGDRDGIFKGESKNHKSITDIYSDKTYIKILENGYHIRGYHFQEDEWGMNFGITRYVLFDPKGQKVRSLPSPTYVEHRSKEWWNDLVGIPDNLDEIREIQEKLFPNHGIGFLTREQEMRQRWNEFLEQNIQKKFRLAQQEAEKAERKTILKQQILNNSFIEITQGYPNSGKTKYISKTLRYKSHPYDEIIGIEIVDKDPLPYPVSRKERKDTKIIEPKRKFHPSEDMSPYLEKKINNFIEKISSTNEISSTNKVKILPQVMKDSLGFTYLWIIVPSIKITPYLEILQQYLGKEHFDTYISNKNKRDGKVYHITLATEKEVDQFSTSALDIFDEDITFCGIWKVENAGNISYFIVVESKKLDAFREKLKLPKKDFHITLGFNPNDVYDQPKNTSTILLEKP